MRRSLRHVRFACAVALPWLAVACHDTTGPQRPARVVVSGAPTVPLLVGSTVQLQAAPLDANGDTLTGRTLTWSSSDVHVATVNALGLVTGVAVGTATVSVSSGGTTDTIPFDFRVGAVVGPYGGRIALFGDSLTLTVPKEALARATTITARVAASTAAQHLVGSSYELTPSTLVFGTNATLTLRYDPARLPAGATQQSLSLGRWNGTGWYPILGSTVDTSSGTVTGQISSAATYGVIWTSVAGLTIAGATSPDTLYVGETARLSAIPHDSINSELHTRPTAWSSSNAGVASVDSSGQVTAAGVGTATLTATVAGQSATFDVVVIGGLVVDWSRAGDWTTFQGDARHDGYVPVTMNPRRFHELWSVIPFAGISPLAAVTADSAVVVTPAIGNGVARLAVLDVATGRQRWNYDFGPVTLGPPAYADGAAYVQTVGPDSLRLWSFDARTAEIRFRTAHAAPWISYQPPTVLGSSVYSASRTGVTAFGAANGRIRWSDSVSDDTSSYSTPHVPPPAISGGTVYAWDGQSTRGLTVLDTTGALQYTIPDSGFVDDGAIEAEAPALGGSNDLLVINGGRLLSFDLVGRRIAWQVQDHFVLTPAIAHGVLYVVNGSHVEARSESDGSLLWSFAPPDGASIPYSCLVSDDILFVSTYGSVFAVDLASHAKVWSYPHNGALAISRQGILFISSASTAELSAIALR